jgi:exo-beta-1,3-glucanase (GH17 family)
MPSVKILLSLVFIVFIHFTIAWLNNQPVDVGPDIPAGKLRSLSFAPFHQGFSPIKEKFPLPEHIQEDMQKVADKTYSIRTYSVRDGMQPTPGFAREYGVEMLMGAWLGNGHAENKLEIEALIKAANDNADVVKRVVVGNEVMLRKDMAIDTLIGYIRQVKQAIKQPVTFADVWSSYMQYPQLFNEVDFITIHILPYWEDEPVAIEHAAAHVEKIIKQIEDKARSMGVNKPILIGESGWPAVGRQRGEAIPSVINEARYIRELIQVANQHGFDYNIVEAFNQPWKSHSEGVVGANWGLLNIDREPVFPLTGPVQENPDWLIEFAWATGLCVLAVGMAVNALQAYTLPQLLIFVSMAQLFGISLVGLVDLGWSTSYNLWQQAYSVLMIVANILLAAGLLQRFHAVLRSQSANPTLTKALHIGYVLFALLAVFKSYQLATDGRYLSFPVEQFAVPAQGILGMLLCLIITENRINLSMTDLSGDTQNYPWERRLAYVMMSGIVGVVLGETYGFMSAYDFIQAHPTVLEGLPVALGYTLQNQQLLSWLLCCLILSLPFWRKAAAIVASVVKEHPITITRR